MKTVLYFVAGVLIGSTATYFLMRDSFKKEEEEAIKAIKDMYRKKDEKRQQIFEMNQQKAEMFDSLIKTAQEKTPIPKEESKEVEHISYENMYVPNDEKVEDEEEDDYIPTYPKEGPSDHPYSITPNEFATTNSWYAKEDLVYYEGDDTLVDDDEDVIDNVDTVLGPDFKSYFGEFEPDVAYIRNEVFGTDYSVVLERGRFYHVEGDDD